jgi:hypothetical protein
MAPAGAVGWLLANHKRRPAVLGLLHPVLFHASGSVSVLWSCCLRTAKHLCCNHAALALLQHYVQQLQSAVMLHGACLRADYGIVSPVAARQMMPGLGLHKTV